MSTIKVSYARATGTLVVEGDLNNNADQREELSAIFSQAAEEGVKLTIETNNLSVNPKTVEMWVRLTENPLRFVEVHYLYSQLSMILGYSTHPRIANPKHTFDLEPPDLAPSETPSGHAW